MAEYPVKSRRPSRFVHRPCVRHRPNKSVRAAQRSPFLMSTAFFHLSTLAVFAVLVVLLLGLWNMMRGSSPNTSQKLMRWRVGLQFFAILVIVAFFLLNR